MYPLALFLHIAAACVWLGHMFFWSLISGPALKRLKPPETAERLRELSLSRGGLGWPALSVLVVTGVIMLESRGPGIGALTSTELWASQYGIALTAKLVLVLFMVGYQAVIGHRRAPRLIYVNMLAALTIVAASVVVGGR